MKQFLSKVKDLSQKAVELKAAMQQLPPKVTEVRETIAATAGLLQQLRLDVQSTVAGLKADNEQRLSQAMQEVNASLDVFLDAGFELGGIDLEISPVERLLIHLNKFEDAHPSELRALIAANQHRKTAQALLTAMLQAQEISDTVELEGLDYSKLIVGIGPIPSVRICWSAKETAEMPVVATPVPAATPPAPSVAPPPAPQSVFGQTSFFERPSLQTAPAVAAVAVVCSSPALPPAEKPAKIEAETESSAVEKADPLARFKKMPNLARKLV